MTSPSSACTWSPLTAPSPMAISRSPASARADSRRSTKRRAATMVAVSISRLVGIDDPTALMCTPSFSQRCSKIGSGLAVTVAMMSADRTAASGLAAASIGTWKRGRSSEDRAAACSALRLQIRTLRSGRTAAIASRWVRACTPAPRMASSPASGRASRSVATPDTAAVRIAVMAAPSMRALRRPVSASKSSTAPWWVSMPRLALPGKTDTAFMPSAPSCPLAGAM